MQQDERRRVDDLRLAGLLERVEVPPEARGVAQELVGCEFERNDEARLVEVDSAAIDKLEAERRLAGSRRAFDEHDVAARHTAEEDLVEPGDAGGHEFRLLHGAVAVDGFCGGLLLHVVRQSLRSPRFDAGLVHTNAPLRGPNASGSPSV